MRLEDISWLSPDAQRQILEKLGKQRKYRNTPTEVDGIRFDSQKEAARFRELRLMEKAGQITDLRLQPEFTLQEAYTTPEGERVRAIRYRADFSYYINGQRVVEDVKSEATRKDKVYRLKNKLAKEHGINVKEV